MRSAGPIPWQSVAARTFTALSEESSLSFNPCLFMALTCSAHGSIKWTSNPASVNIPPIELPNAPEPRIQIFILSSCSQKYWKENPYQFLSRPPCSPISELMKFKKARKRQSEPGHIGNHE